MAFRLSLKSERLPVRPQQPAWQVGLDYLFYLVLAAALAGFCLYLYRFRETLLLYFPFLMQGAATTLAIATISMGLSVILGLAGALARQSPLPLLRQIATVYVEVVRGTPTLVQLLLWGYGIGAFLSRLGFDPYQLAFSVMTVLQSNRLVPANFTFLFYGLLGLSVNNGAYLTEIFRAGMASVPKGQTEAALSLGLNWRQTLKRILLPQAIRKVVPPLTNNFITLIQDSALLSTLGIVELEQTIAFFAYPQTHPETKLFIFVLGALFYLAICYPLALLARYLERQLSQGEA